MGPRVADSHARSGAKAPARPYFMQLPFRFSPPAARPAPGRQNPAVRPRGGGWAGASRRPPGLNPIRAPKSQARSCIPQNPKIVRFFPSGTFCLSSYYFSKKTASVRSRCLNRPLSVPQSTTHARTALCVCPQQQSSTLIGPCIPTPHQGVGTDFFFLERAARSALTIRRRAAASRDRGRSPRAPLHRSTEGGARERPRTAGPRAEPSRGQSRVIRNEVT